VVKVVSIRQAPTQLLAQSIQAAQVVVNHSVYNLQQAADQELSS
jgi:hypothetical protein